jgi:ATP-dependent helicase/nuclease subunit A
MWLIEEALTAAGIPFRVRGGRGYRAADEIAALGHALRVVHNPRDEHALACLLRGPALAAGDDDLLGWFGHGVPATERLEADPRAEVRALVRALHELRGLAARGDLARLVAATAERLALDTAALARPDGARRAANLRRAVALAHDLGEAGRHDLAAFLRHLETLDKLEVEQAEAPAVGEDGDALTLDTMHGAKGLEWPVVVLPDLGRKGAGEAEPWYLAPPEGIAAKLRDPLDGELGRPAGYGALQEREALAGDQELLRLFYVATTRAEQHLLLTATYPALGSTTGRPRYVEGFGRLLCTQVVTEFEHGERHVALGDGGLHLVVAPLPPAPEPPEAAPAASGPDPAAAAEAERVLAAAAEPLATLGGTRYVVSVSELLLFARSPREHYAERHATPEEPPAASEAPPSGGEWDEPAPELGREERMALGRAVHAAIERWTPGAAPDTDAALADELGREPEPALAALAREMAARFMLSAVARDLGAALAAGGDVRRELAFHARIRFPAGQPVAGLEGLLVRGGIDLWLPRGAGDRGAGEGGGVWIVDHKTNAPTAAHPTPASLAEHYAPQLRLYALAAERLLGHDVAGASLLLLDPGWGAEALEVPVDVSGPALEETRRLCRAFAVAELEDRWPADWHDLLA